MDQHTLEVLCAAEQAVSQLIDLCRRHNSTRPGLSRAVARVGRTGSWLLHAVTQLRRKLNQPGVTAAPEDRR